MKEKPKPIEEKKKNGTLPAIQGIDFGEYAGLGYEEATQEAYAIPFLTILQTNSPQCDSDAAEYVKGAKAGDFYNTATKELYDGKEGVKVIQCYWQQKFCEWAPREQGGGFRGAHEVGTITTADLKRNESGKVLLPNGNYLSDTRYHFLLLTIPDGTRTVVLGLASTQVKVSKNWMTNQKMIKTLEGKNPPSFGMMYHLTTKTVSNDKGSWKSLVFDFDHILTPDEIPLFKEAVDFYKQIVSGARKIDHDSLNKGDEEPF
jgi:hypothetical protein